VLFLSNLHTLHSLAKEPIFKSLVFDILAHSAKTSVSITILLSLSYTLFAKAPGVGGYPEQTPKRRLGPFNDTARTGDFNGFGFIKFAKLVAVGQT
jgi:hypothetical protein